VNEFDDWLGSQASHGVCMGGYTYEEEEIARAAWIASRSLLKPNGNVEVDLDELSVLAAAASKGDWIAEDYGSYDGKSSHWFVNTNAGHSVAFDDSGDPAPNHWESRGEHDMKFIAAANPEVVLALIAEIQKLRQEGKRE